jgi:signal transduction histidine kinase
LQHAVDIVNWVNLVAFAVLAAVAIRQWRGRREDAARWAAACFATLGGVVLVGRLLPDHPHAFVERVVLRLDIVVLVLFPYLLYRFTTAFTPPSDRLRRLATAMTSIVVAATIALPRVPQEGETAPWWFNVYLAAFVVHWTVLTIVVAWRLWRAGRAQPSVARRRMHMLSFAATAITVALIVSIAASDPDSTASLASGVFATVSAVAFVLGLAPPAIVRTLWRGPEQKRMQDAIASLMQLATSEQEVAARVLGPMAAIVGARGVLIRNADGEVVGTYNVPEAALAALARGERPVAVDGDADPLELDVPGGGSLVVWTSAYAPFFGVEELRLLRTLGALMGLALDRARLFSQEYHARLALEQADELKSNFIALAAHELRNPVATVSGIAQTLVGRRDVLDERMRVELEDTLGAQANRLAVLVEQLLDLSRLDAEAIRIAPQLFPVRDRVEELVGDAAGAKRANVRVEIDPALKAVADPAAFDRIISNLITNALRYGEPPIVVRAERAECEFRVAVEDRGPGVPPEFVPSLFERFTRSAATRERAVGTGLGLAIARSYALAHDGDLVYEPAEPRGARFKLVLPTG